MNSHEAKKTDVLAVGSDSDLENGYLDPQRFGDWLTNEDEYSDIFFSSRIRLARNLKGYPFPNQAAPKILEEISDRVEEACGICPTLVDCQVFKIQSLPELDKKYLVERRLASPLLVENSLPSLLVAEPYECLSLMVNEEDHLRIQSLQAGLSLESAWRSISRLDDELEDHLQYSYSSKFGYLTSCPTNIGTGLRVSFFAHLPGLALKNEVTNLLEKLPDSEIAVRGFYGEGTESVADIFQISNQLTLGRTEKNVIRRMEKVATEIAALERAARQELLNDDLIKLEDTIFRAAGLLKHARILSSLEAIKLLSTVRLGCELDLIETTNRIELNRLMILIQPAHLQKVNGKPLSSEQRDIARADFIKQNLQI